MNSLLPADEHRPDEPASSQRSPDQRTPDERSPEEQRNDWARRRTELSNERTFAAWLRTGLAAAVAGFGVVKLVPNARPHWLGLVFGEGLALLGLLTLLYGFFSFRQTQRTLTPHLRPRAPISLTGMLVLLAVIVVLAGVFLIGEAR